VHKGPLVDSDLDHHSDSQSDSDVDSEIRFPIGGLPSDEDDSLERDWALSCGLTVMEALKLTKVIQFFFVLSMTNAVVLGHGQDRRAASATLSS
jgi:hypothetical protein